MTNDEIEKLRLAAMLGDKCFEYIIDEIKIGMTEKEIASKMDNFMLSNGAEKLSFDTIVGSGINSSQIHSTPTEKKIEYGDIILLDYGCVLNGYCSDTSRTIFVGEVKEKYKKIYDIVLASQLKAIDEILSGMTCNEADATARDYILENGYNFNHALGHGVGKEVHELPIISPKHNEMLENNTVFSIEPGIYIENEFGVRIEDTVVLKNGRVETLSKANKNIIIIKGE